MESGASHCYLEMLQWIHGLEKFLFHEPGVFILRLDLIFAEKIVLVLGRSESRRWLPSPTLSLYYEGR